MGERMVESQQVVLDRTKNWINTVVIGLNLCPFARKVFQGGLIRYVVSLAADEEELRTELAREIEYLASVPDTETETTLLIHPHVLADFLDYNDFLAEAARVIARLGLRGTIQIASFHPHYRFAGTEMDDVENYTNRSPYPMLHLLREESITKAASETNDLLEIPARNIQRLRSLGREKILELLKNI